MRRRDLVVAGAALALAGSAKAQRIIGFPPANRYENANNWSLDPAVHPIVPMPTRANTLFGMMNGQSLDAQYANAIYPPVHSANQFQFVYGDGTVRAFVEPVFGPSGPGSPLIGSWFGRFGDAIIDSGRWANVMSCLTGIGGTFATDWGPGGKYHSILTTSWFRMIDAELQPDFIAVGQGQTETLYGIPGSVWLDNWVANIDVARNMGITSPWFFARSTYNNGAISASVRAAQAAITSARPNVFAGPDLDVLGPAYRWDNEHWNLAGINAVGGSLWPAAVLAAL